MPPIARRRLKANAVSGNRAHALTQVDRDTRLGAGPAGGALHRRLGADTGGPAKAEKGGAWDEEWGLSETGCVVDCMIRGEWPVLRQ